MSEVARVQVRYYGGAAAAAGTVAEQFEAANVTQLIRAMRARHPGRLPEVLEVASILVDGRAARDLSAELFADQMVDILPPFAGG